MPFSSRIACSPDRKCSDGFLERGWRRVNARGEVRFGSGIWQSNQIKQYEGLFVQIEHTHGLGLTAQCWPNGLRFPVQFDECIQLRNIS